MDEFIGEVVDRTSIYLPGDPGKNFVGAQASLMIEDGRGNHQFISAGTGNEVGDGSLYRDCRAYC